MSTASANNNNRIQQDFITAIFNDNADRDALLQNQLIDNHALVSILSGLDDHTHILQQQVFETVRDNLDSFIALYTGCHQVHERLDGILNQCQNTGNGGISNDGHEQQQQKITDTLHKYQEMIQRTTQNKNEIYVLEKIQRLVQEMDDCEQQLLDSTTPVQDVTRHYLTIHDILSKEELLNGNESVARLLRDKYVQLKDKLVTTLQDKMAAAVVFATPDPENTRTLCVHPTGTTNNAHLLDIFECFDMLDMLSAEMANLKRSIVKHIVTPFFNYCSTGHISVQGNTLYLQRHGQNGGENSHADIACAVLRNIDTMLKFISEQCFAGDGGRRVDETKTRLFGNLILPEIFQQLIQQAIAPAIPASAAQLATFDSVATAVRALEHNCIQQYGFLSDDSEPSSITVYVDNMDSHFATKRRDKVLLEGRRVMIRQLYDVEDIVDMDTKTNTLQEYQITQTPKLLSLLLIDTVKEANMLQQQGSHPVSAIKLFDVVYDLLDLFRAIMPQFHRSQFLSSPQSALVFRNDCYWLANTLTKDLVSTVQNNNNNNNNSGNEELAEKLQDAVDNVRTLGESWFELAMAQWVRVLQQALDKTNKFVGIAENRQQQQACDEAIAQVIDQIRSYATTLRPVISERVYFDLVSRVVDSVLTRLMGDIEDLQDIGADDSHLIAQSLNSLIQLVDVFDSSKGEPATEPQVMQRLPSWRKFWLLKDMLEMNLRDIMDHYRRGELYTFEKKELIHLICALFADTDLRASMIREIQTTNPPPPSVFSPTTTNSSSSPSSSPSVERQQQRATSPFVSQQQQEQEKPLTPKTSSLAMVMQQDDNEGGDGWGWDDEPVIPSQPVQGTGQQLRTMSSLSMMEHDDEAPDGWGLDDDDEPLGIPQEQEQEKPKGFSEKKTHLSMELDNDEEQEAGGWGDDDEPLILPQEDEGQEKERKSGDNEKPTDVVKKTSPLSMKFNDIKDEEEQGWGFDDNEPLVIPQEHKEGQSSMMQLDDNKDEKHNSKESSKSDTVQVPPPSSSCTPPQNTQQEKSTPKKTSSTLSMAQHEEEGDGWGWDDADEDVNWNNLH